MYVKINDNKDCDSQSRINILTVTLSSNLCPPSAFSIHINNNCDKDPDCKEGVPVVVQKKFSIFCRVWAAVHKAGQCHATGLRFVLEIRVFFDDM